MAKKELQGFPTNHESFKVVSGKCYWVWEHPKISIDIIDTYIWDGFILFISCQTSPNTHFKILLGMFVPYLLPAIVAVAAVVGVLVATAGPGHSGEWEDRQGICDGQLGARKKCLVPNGILGIQIFTTSEARVVYQCMLESDIQ